MSIEKKIAEVTRVLLENDNILFSYLYGSFARGEQHRFSDIDIAVYMRKPSLESYRKLLRSLPPSIGYVDLRVLNELPPLLRLRIIAEGRLLFSRDEEALEKFMYETLVEALEVKDQIQTVRKLRAKGFLNAV